MGFKEGKFAYYKGRLVKVIKILDGYYVLVGYLIAGIYTGQNDAAPIKQLLSLDKELESKVQAAYKVLEDAERFLQDEYSAERRLGDTNP